MALTPEEATRELARRELERRKRESQQGPQVAPISGSLPRVFRGLGEGALTMGTGALAAIPAGFGGLMAMSDGPDAAAETVRNIQENLTFKPRTREGEIGSFALSIPFQGVERVADATGQVAADVTGSPAVGTGVKTTALMAPALIGRQGIGRGKLSNQQQVLQRAQSEGYVTPTSSANPQSAGRGFVEGVSGKPRLQQEASFKNQQVTNRIVAEELGLPEGTVITRDALDGVRARAGQAYEVMDNAGVVTTSTAFRRDLANAVANLKKVSKDFEVLAKKDSPVQQALEIAEGLNKPTFNASSVAPVTRILRDEASAAFRNGQKQVGSAYRDLSKAIEDAAEAHLARFGDPAAVQAFRDARQTIAKSYSVEKALDGDGFVSATKLANQLAKREPLSDGLLTIAEFAEQFPRSARVIKEKPIQTGMLPGITGGAGLGLSALEPTVGLPIAAMAFAPPLVRGALLSRLGQGALGKPLPPVTGVNQAITGSLLSGGLAAPSQSLGVGPTAENETILEQEKLRRRLQDTPFSLL